MNKKQPHIIIISGGRNSKQRKQSLRSGFSAYHGLKSDYSVSNVHLDKSGKLEAGGRETTLADQVQANSVILNMLHGKDAHRLQETCREHNIPHTGNAHTNYSSGSAINRKDTLRKTKTPTIPYWRLANNYDAGDDVIYGSILHSLSYPVVVSPLPDAFSVDALVVESEDELLEVVQACFSLEAPVSVSDTYTGNLYSVMVVRGFREEPLYAFPPRELLHDHPVSNTYTPDTEPTHGGNPHGDLKDVEELAKTAVKELHLRDVARVDILETETGELFVLDVDPHPALDRHSLLHDAALDVGATLSDVFSVMAETAFQD